MKIILGLLLTILLAFSFTESTYASPNPPTNNTPQTDANATTDMDDDNDMEWGWIGLLGLAGLLGLRGRDERKDK